VLTGQSTAAAINEPEAAAWRPDYVADDLRAAVTWIVEDAHQRIMMKA
jgi:hypothetical protein